MLEESSGGVWISRRDERIRRPITSIGLVTVRGIPYLAPEIQLFYKAKNQRAKDEADFAATLPILTEAQSAGSASCTAPHIRGACACATRCRAPSIASMIRDGASRHVGHTWDDPWSASRPAQRSRR